MDLDKMTEKEIIERGSPSIKNIKGLNCCPFCNQKVI